MSVKKEARSLYRIIFQNQSKTFEIYAHGVGQSSLFGFIEVEELVFGKRSNILVDPSEDAIKQEFENTKRIYLPLHSIVRIDEMKKATAFRARVVNLANEAGGEKKKRSGGKQRLSNIYTPIDPFSGK